MPEKHLYEYAVIRYVPRVEREEFLNVGIVLFSKRQKFIKVLWRIDEQKVKAFCMQEDVEELRRNLEAFAAIADGSSKASRIALLDHTERFRWLTAVKSSSIQTSRPHPGLCNDLDATIAHLFNELVV